MHCHTSNHKYMLAKTVQCITTVCTFYNDRYMKRRCIFLDNLPHFNYNTGIGESSDGSVPGDLQYTDTSKLGSTLMEAMLKEVSHFCNPEIKTTWSSKSHQQVSNMLIFGEKSVTGFCFMICQHS